MTKMKIQYLGNFRMECIHSDSGVAIVTDAPKDIGGQGASFSPTDLFAVSLASCMLTIMAMTGKKMGFDLEGATAEVEKQMVSAPTRRIGKLIVRIRVPSLPSPQIREKLEAVAFQCPVHASIHPDVVQEIDFVWGM